MTHLFIYQEILKRFYIKKEKDTKEGIAQYYQSLHIFVMSRSLIIFSFLFFVTHRYKNSSFHSHKKPCFKIFYL